MRKQSAPYRGLRFVRLWGEFELEATSGRAGADPDDDDGGLNDDKRPQSRDLVRRPKLRESEEGEEDEQIGPFLLPRDDLKETAQDPMGLQRPGDNEDQANPDELADSLSEVPEARLVRTADRAREVLVSDSLPPHATAEAVQYSLTGLRYPEWDFRIGAYHPNAATVQVRRPRCGDPDWVETIQRRYAGLIAQVMRCFERLRPRRCRQGQQPDGTDIDIAAYVAAHADRQAGGAPTDRLYEQKLPQRREIAMTLLVDLSASTDSWVRDTRRIIDVEKDALYIVSRALETLSDRFSIQGFSSHGPKKVTLFNIKDFNEPSHAEVYHRLAGLEPESYTRTGAALRHATTLLTKQSVRHQLLLLLSDGKPNDMDLYEGRYGVEDTRQAVAEATLQGVTVFCLTIDREAPAYISRIFGPRSYAILRQPERLPTVLLDLVRQLLPQSA